MERAKKVLIYALVLLPLALGLKNFFDISNPLVWGDAPYFYMENLKELFNMPFAWDIRNSNFGSSQALTLWLFLPTFFQGFLYKLFGLSHEFSIRIIFYLPYILSASTGVYLLLNKFKLKSFAKAFGVIFYMLNSYSVLLIDGGQIGILLSYGLFPAVILTFLNLADKRSTGSFLLAILFHFLIINTDLRIALIAIFFELVLWVFIISIKNAKQLFSIFLVWIIIILLSGFWVLPFLKGLQHGQTNQALTGEQSFIQLVNSFYLFQPHFPENDFGNLRKTPVYFIFVPFILLLGILDKKREPKLFGLLFLFFVFLSKGVNPPFGEVYTFFINLPLGNAFRDSSKFYIPLILTASFLIGFTVDYIQLKFKKLRIYWLGLIYIFLLISIYPVFTGGIAGVLGKNPNKQDFNNIYELVGKDPNSYRTLWFNERPSLGFTDWNHPGVSANLLFRERPFASMIDGDYDLFGFLHKIYISEWYELLGIKYIFYPPYERDKSLTRKEKIERAQFENFISTIPGLTKINQDIVFPAYSTNNPLPKIFGQEKIIITLGGDEKYEELLKTLNYNLENAGIIFLESCKFDPEIIFNIDPKTYLIGVSKDKNDLYLSFFCKNFISPMLSRTKDWAIEAPDRYLNWKAQLLERGIRNYDYDFDKGFAYSTKGGEKLEFKLDVDKSQNYYLPIRYFTASQSSGLKVDFNNESYTLKSKTSDKLEWNLIGPLNLQKGDYQIILTNIGGLSAFNTLGLIPQSIFEQKKKQIDSKLLKINTFSPYQISDTRNLLENKFTPLDYKMVNPSEYKVIFKPGVNWLVFSERFDPDWQLNSSNRVIFPLPFYSMINGYYTADISDKGALKIYYGKQESIKKGILISIFAFSLVGFAVIFHIISRSGYIKKYFTNFKN